MKKEEFYTDAEIEAIGNSESDESYWNRMFDARIAQEASDADDAEWRAGGVVDEE